MCAIWGISLLNGCVLKDASVLKRIIKGLCVAGEARGRHACGVAFCSEKKIVVVKKAVTGYAFSESPELGRALAKYSDIHSSNGPITILGHNRMTTQGTEKNFDNNHPIVANDVVGVHNGMIGNDYELFRQYAIRRRAQVDSEAIFRLLDMYSNRIKMNHEESLKKIHSQLTGTYAIAAVNSNDPFKLILAKNNNPIHYRMFTELGLFMFASTEAMLNLSIKGLAMGDEYSGHIGSDKGMILNLYLNQIKEFSLDEHKYSFGALS